MCATQPTGFGEMLRTFRRASAMTQEELAERAGVSPRTVSDLERGIYRAPQRATIRMLADALRLSTDDRDRLEAAVVRTRGLPSVTAIQNDLPTGPTNLPVQTTRFVGRIHETQAARALLRRPDVRLLTLTGAGGTGKTRLAVEVASGLRTDFPDGVFMVELASVRDPALVASSVARALGVAEAGDRRLVESLKDTLREKRLLLLLDNFEHVRDAADLPVDLLESSSGLKMLITSRIVLRLAGEHDFTVPPLTYPGRRLLAGRRTMSPEELTSYDAAALFVQRAQASQPDFTVTPETGPAVARICSRLDGLPLAIELAAARTRLLSPHAMLTRLERRLPLLARGTPDRPARHQSLRSTMDWSHELLEERARGLLARLAVFAGSFTLTAAEAICGDSDDPDMDVLDGVAALLDSSLLQRKTRSDGEPCFVMLATIREYALERLGTRGDAEVERMRSRHLAWYLCFAEDAEPELTGPEQATWLERLEDEQDNLRAALDWALESGDCKGAVRLGAALWRWWYARGHLREGDRSLALLLAAGTSAGLDGAAARAKALNGAGVLAYLLGDADRAAALYREAVDLSRSAGDRAATATSLTNLGMVAHYAGEYDLAAMQYREALDLSRELGNKRIVAVCLNNLGSMATDRGDFLRAEPLIEESLVLFRELGDSRNAAGLLSNLARLADERGDVARAESLALESVTLLRDLDDKPGLAEAIQSLGTMMQRRGEHERAAPLIEEALDLGRETGDKWMVASSLLELGKIAQAQHALTRASTLCEESLTLHRELQYKQGIAAALAALGEIAATQHLHNTASARYLEALSLYHSVDDRPGMAACLRGLASLAAAHGQALRSARLHGAAAALHASDVTGPTRGEPPTHEPVAHADGPTHEAWQEGYALTRDEAFAYAMHDAAAVQAAADSTPLTPAHEHRRGKVR